MLNVTHLFKNYPGHPGVLKDVSFDLPSNGLFCVVGKSGAGKSTLLNCIGGLDGFDAGSIVFDGISIGELTTREKSDFLKNTVSFCFQDSNLFPELSVLENLLFLGPKKENPEKAKQILSTLGLEGFENKKINEISGGEQERVAVGRSLYKNAALLLADEPTGSLDEESAKSVFSALKKASEQALVLVVTHDLSLASSFADGILRIEGGKVLSKPTDCPKNASLEKDKNLYSGKDLFRISLRHLKRSSAKAVLSSLLLGICFVSLMPAIDTSLRSRSQLLYQGIEDSSSSKVGLRKAFRSKGRDSLRNFLKDDSFGEEAMSLLRPVFSDAPQQTGFTACHYLSYDLEKPESASAWWLAQASSAGFVPVAKEDRFLAGRAPESETECAISFLEYRGFSFFGFQDGTSSFSSAQLSTPESFLSLSPTLKVDTGNIWKSLQIVGVVDTSFDLSYYGLEVAKETSSLSEIKRTELSVELESGPHNAIFTSPSAVQSFFVEPSSFSLLDGETATVDVTPTFSSSFRSIQAKEDVIALPLSNSKGNGIYLPLGSFGRAFEDQSIGSGVDYSSCLRYGVPFSSLVSPLRDLSFASVFSSAPAEGASPLSLLACGDYVAKNGLPKGDELSSLIAFAQQDYDDAFANGRSSQKVVFSDRTEAADDLLRSYWVSYLASPYLHLEDGAIRLEGGYFASMFASAKGLDITASYARNLLANVQGKEVSLNLKRSDQLLQNQKLSLLGLSLPKRDLDSAAFSCDDSLFACFRSLIGDSGLISFYFFDKGQTGLLHQALEGGLQNGSFSLVVSHRVISSYDKFSEITGDGFRLFLVLVAGVTALLSILFLVLLSFSNKQEKGHEYALAESLGISKGRLLLWTFLEGLPIMIVGFVIGLLGDALFIPLANHYMGISYGIAFSAFAFSGLGFLICFLGSVILSFVLALFSEGRFHKLSLKYRLTQN